MIAHGDSLPPWGRASGVGVAGSEATETPTPEGRGVHRWALTDHRREPAGAPENPTPDALAGAAGFDTVEPTPGGEPLSLFL